MKCLCIKEIFNLDKVEFRLGSFIPTLEKGKSEYDMVFASGILYHMEDPVKLLKLAAKASKRLFIWTHYYDKDIISSRNELRHKFAPARTLIYDGISYEYSIQSYENALSWSGFCGGPKPTSKWLTRESILKALCKYGFDDIQINFEHREHQNGPAFAICATKTGGEAQTIQPVENNWIKRLHSHCIHRNH